jgi:hypothetical protein
MFPLFCSSDIFSINRLIVILQIIGQCEVKTHYDVTDKNNNVSFEGLNIYYHRQLNIWTNWTTALRCALCLNTSRFSRPLKIKVVMWSLQDVIRCLMWSLQDVIRCLCINKIIIIKKRYHMIRMCLYRRVIIGCLLQIALEYFL